MADNARTGSRRNLLLHFTKSKKISGDCVFQASVSADSVHCNRTAGSRAFAALCFIPSIAAFFSNRTCVDRGGHCVHTIASDRKIAISVHGRGLPSLPEEALGSP